MAAPIIDSLVNDLSPRTPMRSWQGAAAVACATLAACVLLVGALGMRKDLMGGDVPGIFFIRQGILLLLGSATSVAVIGMAQPSVGRDGGGWGWALGAALLFPATSLLIGIFSGGLYTVDTESSLTCIISSGLSAILIGGALVFWLRRGAPTAPERAAWLTGLAAGALGAFAYGLHCPMNGLDYIGLWYGTAVSMCAVTGRLVVPYMIRW